MTVADALEAWRAAERHVERIGRSRARLGDRTDVPLRRATLECLARAAELAEALARRRYQDEAAASLLGGRRRGPE